MRHVLYSSAAILAIATAAPAQDLEFPIGEGAFNWDSFEEFSTNNDLSGQTLEISGPWVSADAEAFEVVLDYFREATGATVNYSGSDSFEQDIVISVEAGSPPNIAIFPQPGLASDMAQRGALTPLEEGTADWIRENYAAGESWVDLASFEGPEGETNLYTFPYKIDVKSLVWYVPEAFEEAGYEVPETMEDLKALTEQIASEGETPWCIALGSGAATGWPATDWVEDLMLRTVEPSVYDQWVNNEIPFDDPAVVNAIEEFGWFARSDEFVSGGSQAVPTTDFRDAPAGLFTFPPECYMMKQATFIPEFFPEGTELGTDADFFYFPAYEAEDLGQPVLGAGTMFAITEESDAARTFIDFLQTPIAHEIAMARWSFLTPYTAVDPEVFRSDTQRNFNQILTEATTFRFDASDLMPGEIGANAFWSGMIDYVSGAEAESVAQSIQQRWESMR